MEKVKSHKGHEPAKVKRLSRRRFSWSGRLFTAVIVIVVIACLGAYTLFFSHAGSITAKLYLTPATQAVTSGSNITVSIMVDTGGASINTVQSVLSYNASNFSLVSITPDATFGSFPETTSSGSIQFTAATTTPVSGVHTVATAVFQAGTTGTSAISLASVCPTGTYALTCSAAYDSTDSTNDLGPASSGYVPITNGSYTVSPILPTVPTSLHATAVTTTSTSLSWTASTDVGGSGLAGYKLYRNGALIASPTTTSYTDTGLSPGTSYNYTITAYDTAGNSSAASSPVSVATVALPTTPTGLQSAGTTTTGVRLTWNASTDAGGSGLAGYKLYRNGTLIASPTTTSYTDTGLAPGTPYSYTILAYDAAGYASSLSTAVSVTTATVIGDVDSDGHVTGHDLSLLLAHYGANYAPGEFDGTTVVEGHDLSLLLANYGR